MINNCIHDYYVRHKLIDRELGNAQSIDRLKGPPCAVMLHIVPPSSSAYESSLEGAPQGRPSSHSRSGPYRLCFSTSKASSIPRSTIFAARLPTCLSNSPHGNFAGHDHRAHSGNTYGGQLSDKRCYQLVAELPTYLFDSTLLKPSKYTVAILDSDCGGRPVTERA
jgi:hypothetical protein